MRIKIMLIVLVSYLFCSCAIDDDNKEQLEKEDKYSSEESMEDITSDKSNIEQSIALSDDWSNWMEYGVIGVANNLIKGVDKENGRYILLNQDIEEEQLPLEFVYISGVINDTRLSDADTEIFTYIFIETNGELCDFSLDSNNSEGGVLKIVRKASQSIDCNLIIEDCHINAGKNEITVMEIDYSPAYGTGQATAITRYFNCSLSNEIKDDIGQLRPSWVSFYEDNKWLNDTSQILGGNGILYGMVCGFDEKTKLEYSFINCDRDRKEPVNRRIMSVVLNNGIIICNKNGENVTIIDISEDDTKISIPILDEGMFEEYNNVYGVIFEFGKDFECSSSQKVFKLENNE